MLVKVGKIRINLAHVEYVGEIGENGEEALVSFASGSSYVFEKKDGEADQFFAAWDKWAQFQSDAQTINEFAVAENLKQINQAQNKSGIIQPVPKMPLVNRGRG